MWHNNEIELEKRRATASMNLCECISLTERLADEMWAPHNYNPESWQHGNANDFMIISKGTK